MLALTVASSPYNKRPTKLIETQGMKNRERHLSSEDE
jgi:hypothetical protein